MGVTRADLVRTGRYLDMPEEEWEKELEHRKVVINRMAANDAWAVKIRKPVGIILTAHCGGLPFLKGSVESWKKLGYWVCVAYDNFIDPEWQEANYDRFMPAKDVMDQIDTFLIPHYQTWGGPSYPYMWLLRLAGGIMEHFEHVAVINGDCIIEKPEGFQALLDLMGDADFMSAGPVLEREIGTAGFIIKGKHLPALAKHLIDHVVPFEEYEKSTQEFGNTEGRMAVAVRDLGLKQAIVPVMPKNDQLHFPHGTWFDMIGMRHIHGEFNHAYRYKAMPPPLKYFDERYLGSHDLNALREWERTNDIRVIEEWWCKT